MIEDILIDCFSARGLHVFLQGRSLDSDVHSPSQQGRHEA
jgi:hypothetical protein